MKLYGIPNCNSVKKARTWLADHGIAADFHDFKKQGITETILRNWLEQIPRDKLINRQGTTWRQLPGELKAMIDNNDSAVALMLEKPSVIKRPLLEQDGKVLHVGFDEAVYQSILENGP